MKMATKNFLKLARTDSITWTSALMASNAFECLGHSHVLRYCIRQWGNCFSKFIW